VSRARSALDTPMMRQFLAIKAGHPDAILLYRMGDFYEMFLEDAERAAPLLEIALTTRDKGKPDAVPMCGIPVHSADGYVKRLTEAGCRVAICEQVEDPRQTKKLVKREVVEVVTPGLVGDPASLDGRQEVALVALVPGGPDGTAGLAALDVSTGDFRAALVPGAREGGLPSALVEELERIAPRELLLPAAHAEALGPLLERHLPGVARTELAQERFDPAAMADHAEGLEPDAADPAARAAAGLLGYLVANQPFALHQTRRLRRYAQLGVEAVSVPHRLRTEYAARSPKPLVPPAGRGALGCHGARRRHAPAPRAVRKQRRSLAARHTRGDPRPNGVGPGGAPPRALGRLPTARSRCDRRAPGGRRLVGGARPPARPSAQGAGRRA